MQKFAFYGKAENIFIFFSSELKNIYFCSFLRLLWEIKIFLPKNNHFTKAGQCLPKEWIAACYSQLRLSALLSTFCTSEREKDVKNYWSLLLKCTEILNLTKAQAWHWKLLYVPQTSALQARLVETSSQCPKFSSCPQKQTCLGPVAGYNQSRPNRLSINVQLGRLFSCP